MVNYVGESQITYSIAPSTNKCPYEGYNESEKETGREDGITHSASTKEVPAAKVRTT